MPPKVAQNDDPFASFEAESAKLGLMPTEGSNQNIPSQQVSEPDPFAGFEAESAKLGLTPDQPAQTDGVVNGTPSDTPLGMYDGSLGSVYKAFSAMPDSSKKEMIDDALRIAIKAPVAGASKILDFFSTMPINAAVDAINGLAHTNIPHAKSFEHKAEEGIDYISQGRTKGGRHMYEGVKLATELALPYRLASRLTLGAYEMIKDSPVLIEVLKKIGTNNPKALVGAGGAGIAMHEAKEDGVGTLGTMASGVGGALVTEGTLSVNPKTVIKHGARIAGKILGVGEKSLDQKAIQSARNLEVDLPISAASNSSQVAMANQTVSNIPLFNKTIQAVKEQAHNQYQNAYKKLLNEVSPEIETTFGQAVNEVYSQTNKLFRPNDKIDFSDAVNAAQELLRKTEAATMSNATIVARKHAMDILKYAGKDESYLLEAVKNNKAYLTATPQMKKKILDELRVGSPEDSQKLASEVLRTKIELNKIMKDKNIFTREDKDSLDLLTELQNGIRSSLSKYGNKYNPEWNEAFNIAEKQYGQMAKRKDLENLLEDVMKVEKTDSPNYGKLIDMFSKKEYKGELVNALGQQQYTKVKDFLNVAKAMYGLNKRIPNPSGTAVMTLFNSAISGIGSFIATGSMPAGIVGVAGLWGSLGGVYALILSNPKATELAMKFAKNPSENLAARFNTLLKENIGLGIEELNQASQGQQEKKPH